MGTVDTLRQRLYRAADQGDALAGEALEAVRDLVTTLERLLTPGLSIGEIQAVTREARRVLRKYR